MILAAQRETAQALFNAQLAKVLRAPEFRVSVIQRLVAATIDVAEGFRVVELAIDRVRNETGGPVFNLSNRLVRALDAGCVTYAEMRCLPYKKVVKPIIRGWRVFLSCAQQEGLTEEEGYAVIRDLLRKIPASHWSRVEDIDRALLEELTHGFRMVGIAKSRDRRGMSIQQGGFR